jgi:hypothetical protein
MAGLVIALVAGVLLFCDRSGVTEFLDHLIRLFVVCYSLAGWVSVPWYDNEGLRVFADGLVVLDADLDPSGALLR